MNQRLTYRFPFASYPALRLALLLIGGICLARLYSESPFSLWLPTFFVIFILWAIVEFLPISHLKLWKTALSVLLYSLMVVSFGAVLMPIEQFKADELRKKTELLSLYEWDTVTVSGTIYSRGKSSSGRNIFELEVEQTELPERTSWDEVYNLRLYGSDGEPEIPVKHRLVKVDVELYSFPEKRNPHEFDYGQWLLSRSIVAHGELVTLHESKPGSSGGWVSIRQNVLNRIDRLFDEQEASLAKALFIGHKKELTNETRQAFSRAGLSHIMAVSGMHVGFIVAPFWLLIPWLWRWKWGKWAGLVMLTLLLFSYAGITGFSASVNRASIMAWLLTYGKLFQKLRHSVNLLAVAALILLLIRPSNLFGVGFQLSFSAVLIILLVMPEAQRLISPKYRYNRIGGLMTIVIISVIVQIGLFPILAAYFGEFSLMGPVANALVVPMLGLVVPVGLLVSVAGDWFGSAAIHASTIIGWALKWIGEVALTAGGTSWSYITVDGISPWLFPVWIAIVLAVAAIRIPQIRWKLFIFFLFGCNIFIADLLLRKAYDNRLELTALDVGQGDAIYIKTPAGKHILVDAGRWSPGGNSGERTIIPYLKHRQVKSLDAVILSHPHADHIGGMPDLMREFPIKAIYQSSYPYDSRLYENYMSLADSLAIPVHNVSAGDMITIDPAVRLFILGPEAQASVPGNINNASVAFRLDYLDASFLFTGDAEKKQERLLVNRYGDFLDTEFLKTGHHGSKTSSSVPFISQVTPDITITSVAFRNRFGHPHRSSVSTLTASGAKNYFTSLSGALIFTSDGKTIVREQ